MVNGLLFVDNIMVQWFGLYGYVDRTGSDTRSFWAANERLCGRSGGNREHGVS